ncbi:MAG: hypothetical protein RL557_100 [archaeon]|jgi:hypothetical protein
MSQEKFRQDIERVDEITRILREKIKGKSQDSLAAQLAGVIGLRKKYCKALLSNYLGCGIIGISDGDPYNVGRTIPEADLYRLSTFYKLLDINPKDPVIELTKELNKNFVYPPQLPAEKEYSCAIRVQFSHKDLSLKSEQRKSLETLALENKNPK